jgi:hypothetical protein
VISELRRQIRKSIKEYWNRFQEKIIKEGVWRATTYIRVVISNTILILKGEDETTSAEIEHKRNILLKKGFLPASPDMVEKPKIEKIQYKNKLVLRR